MTFNPNDWVGQWESFEHYIASNDPAMQITWEQAQQAALANPATAPMAAHGIRAFWSMACATTSPEQPQIISGWRVDAHGDDGFALTWLTEGGNELGTFVYTVHHVVPKGLEGSPTTVFEAADAPADCPFRWLLAIDPMPARGAFAQGGLLSHLHFQYASDLNTLLDMSADPAGTLRNQRWYATMCADEGTIDDRCAIVRALHHLED